MAPAFDFGSGMALPPSQQPTQANTSRPFDPGRQNKPTRRAGRKRQNRQRNAPIQTNDLSQQFKPRHEDGSEIKIQHAFACSPS